MTDDLRTAATDLLLGGRCVGCGRGGRPLCAACVARLPASASRRTLLPAPAGLAPTYAADTYEGVVRNAVLAHKERGVSGLGVLLGERLALAVGQALHELGADPALRVVLVPVPSRRAAVRERGHDATLTLCAAARTTLRRAGHDVVVRRLLRVRPGVVDQAGLDRAARAANLAGSMAVVPGALRRLARERAPAYVVLADDVLTTGSTAAEAQRALGAVGLPLLAVATVAATPRRSPPADVRQVDRR